MHRSHSDGAPKSRPRDRLPAHSRRRLGILEPKGESTSLALYDDTQLTKLAMAKTVHKEECAFCGKEGRHHASVLLRSR